MKRSAFSTICLILILTVQTQAQGQNSIALPEANSTNKFAAEWRLRFSGTDVHDEQSQSKLVDIRTDVKATYTLSNSLYLDFQPTLRLQSGQTQSMDGADKPENKITLNQAAANYQPFQPLKFSAGALNQRYLHTGLLMDSIAFPAARSELSLKAGNLSTGLALESAIPTSTSLSTNTRELEATPSLNTATFKINWKNTQNLSWKMSAGYFAFNNLPSAVAQSARLLGNEVNKLSDAQYSFMYRYEGIEASTQLTFPVLASLDLTLGAEFLENQKAPTDLNKASLLSAKGEVPLNRNMNLIVGGGYFSIAPEAAVSFFNAGTFETNRVGYFAESALSFKKERFSIGFKYSDAEVMFSSTLQSREKTMIIQLETFYANI